MVAGDAGWDDMAVFAFGKDEVESCESEVPEHDQQLGDDFGGFLSDNTHDCKLDKDRIGWREGETLKEESRKREQDRYLDVLPRSPTVSQIRVAPSATVQRSSASSSVRHGAGRPRTMRKIGVISKVWRSTGSHFGRGLGLCAYTVWGGRAVGCGWMFVGRYTRTRI